MKNESQKYCSTQYQLKAKAVLQEHKFKEAAGFYEPIVKVITTVYSTLKPSLANLRQAHYDESE